MNIKEVKVTEVGPRDGFQSEKTILKTEDKIDIINNLIEAGFPRIEVSSFVSPKAIPQLADAESILSKVNRSSKTTLAALVPNSRGALRAVEAKLDEIVVFLSASESHNKKNVNRSVDESLQGFKEIADIAGKNNIPIHVWVDETRPRNQGFNLTAWELINENIDCSLIVDNVGGHLMQHNQVDMCIVGTDRTTLSGDVCNKIGTYLKALAAFDNNIPFYVSAPISSIDFNIRDGISEIPIETRDPKEVSSIWGVDENKNMKTISIVPENSKSANYAFDVTPSKYISKLITEKGVVDANEISIKGLKNK